MPRSILACVFLTLEVAVTGYPQDQQKPINNISDIAIGMPREYVLAELIKTYDLQQVRKGVEIWLLFDKGPTKRKVGTVMFSQGKVQGINTNLYDPMLGEDAVQLVRRLFQLLYFNANPPPQPNVLERLGNTRYALAQLTLEELRADKLEEERIWIGVNRVGYVVTARRLPPFPDQVEIERVESAPTILPPGK